MAYRAEKQESGALSHTIKGSDGKRHVLSVRRRFVRCGDSNCHTCSDGPGHGPYLYRRWKEGGKVKEKYAGKA